jgi:nucleotide-binding universal stress UspA family protein
LLLPGAAAETRFGAPSIYPGSPLPSKLTGTRFGTPCPEETALQNAILVPLDGTLAAERAIPVATAVALRTGAELHPVLVHLTDYFRDLDASPASVPDADRALALREAEYLAATMERMAQGRVKVRLPVVLHGDVPDAVAAHVRTERIGGVVMTTHRRGAIERLLVPSAAEGIRHRLAVPLILVSVDAEQAAPDVIPSTAPLGNILVALDGSADSESALDQAIEIGGRVARYVLLRVVSPPPQLSSVYLPQATILRHRDEVRLRAEAADYLNGIEERVKPRTAHVEKRLGVHSRPGHLIVRAAEDVGADLIAVGSHGHGPLREALFGSVAHDVLQQSRTPVLVTRAPG